MSTTAEKLQIIIDNKAAIKQAIIEKGGEVGDFTTYASAIANLPSGGGGGDVNPTAEKNDVTFYDYDGTIRYSYTAEEFLALTEMPPLPTQKGLICQEWNWSYEDAMEYVAEYGVLDVGATYITDNGKTRLYIRIAAEGRMDVPLYFQQTIANGVVIDWGDGSATETLDGTGYINTTHHYNAIGDYCISLDVADRCTLTLGHRINSYCIMGSTGNNGKVYCNMLRKVEVGARVFGLTASCFAYCESLLSVTIPSYITVMSSNAFAYCYSISALIIPNGVKSLELSSLYDANSLNIIVLPNSVTSIKPRVLMSPSLSSVVIPGLILEITMSGCRSLSSVIFPSSIENLPAEAFYNCYGMAFYDFSHHTAVPTLNNANAFTSIPEDCKIIVPDALYDEWIAATNWSTYASYIIKKTDWDASKNIQ